MHTRANTYMCRRMRACAVTYKRVAGHCSKNMKVNTAIWSTLQLVPTFSRSRTLVTYYIHPFFYMHSLFRLLTHTHEKHTHRLENRILRWQHYFDFIGFWGSCLNEVRATSTKFNNTRGKRRHNSTADLYREGVCKEHDRKTNPKTSAREPYGLFVNAGTVVITRLVARNKTSSD